MNNTADDTAAAAAARFPEEVALLMRALGALLNVAVPSSRRQLARVMAEGTLSGSLQSLWDDAGAEQEQEQDQC